MPYLDKDRQRAATAEWGRKNRERKLAHSRKWKAANPAMCSAACMRRHAAKLQRTPAWADDFLISCFYEEAATRTAETGVKHEVDHFYPLQGKLVSGLHVHENLRVITKAENAKKRNTFEVHA